MRRALDKKIGLSESAAVSAEALEQVRELCRAGMVRGRYKYLRVSVRDGRIRVCVPSRVSKSDAERFIEKHLEQVAQWRGRQLEALRQRQENNPLRVCYRDGGSIGYLGKTLRLCCKPDIERTQLAADGGELCVRAPVQAQADAIEAEVRGWLLARFDERLRERLAHWVRRTGLHPVQVKASNAKMRWGSCSQKGVVRISWRTICLTQDVLDYVLVHELTHLKHFDHSPAFWSSVRSFYPETDAVRAALRRVRICDLA